MYAYVYSVCGWEAGRGLLGWSGYMSVSLKVLTGIANLEAHDSDTGRGVSIHLSHPYHAQLEPYSVAVKNNLLMRSFDFESSVPLQ